MSTLIVNGLQSAGQTLVRTAGQLALNYAGQTISNLFDDRTFEGPRLRDFHLLTSRDGAPMARVFGRMRLAGNVIWASRLKEHITEERVGGKGGPTQRNYSYSISFAVGLCEGEIQGIDRLWVNGAPLAQSGLSMRVYTGSDTQMSDPLIAAIEGDDAPAFRGTAYIVFEDFALDEYGARLPQINAEVIRIPPSQIEQTGLETLITGVNLLPGSGEYAYGTIIAEDVTGPGQSVPVNLNNLTGKADILAALDQLETQLPECRNVSLIISWFGTDLRAGFCEIRPGVENPDRLMPDAPWQVSGDTRDTAYVVSQSGGQPNYGGTPSDVSIIEAIKELKARGFAVTIYPFILMDIPAGNGLPDPYGGAEQAAFPWRGRIMSENDMSPAASADISTFFGMAGPGDFGIEAGLPSYAGPDEYSFRRFILHCAKLAQAAGGVDRFVIGSEMRGLTTSRSGSGSYPAVAAFKALAADVKSVLGAGTDLTYAADWSEYFGHHPQDGSGDVYFHLDPLWSDANIAAVGIDAYFPLSDWRDGEAHLDRAGTDSIYDPVYLSASMEGGEGYDWYYADSADRTAQIRTPITDGQAGKPWVFRYKDVRNWWGQAHFDRPGGIEASTPTAWLQQSKPIWFMEIGCPAIDKGANQPNVFVDPKSSESFGPYFSSGTRDDLMQRRYIETFHRYWAYHNDVSALDGRPMVDMSAAHVWCWDARPFPDFPARQAVWADGQNWQTGHWITGRTGLVPLRDVIADVTGQAGISDFDVSGVSGLIEGYVIDRSMSARAALGPLLQVFDVDIIESADRLKFRQVEAAVTSSLQLDDIVLGDDEIITVETEDAAARPLDVRINYIDTSQDYQPGSASARDLDAETVRIIDLAVPLALSPAAARNIAAHTLERVSQPAREARFTLGPQILSVDAGDVLTLPDQTGLWKIDSLRGVTDMAVVARQITQGPLMAISGGQPEQAAAVPWTGRPVLSVLDIPNLEQTAARTGPLLGAQMSPFSPLTARSPVGGEAAITAPAAMGVLLTSLPAGPIGRWDNAHTAEFYMPGADLAAVTDSDALAGANRFAVETDTGWEILQAQSLSLIGEHTYRAAKLLRGLAGSDADMMAAIPDGAKIAFLGRGWTELSLGLDVIGDVVNLEAVGAGRAGEAELVYQARHLRPLSPVHLTRRVEPDGKWSISWIRRTRREGDSWGGLDVPLGEETERYLLRVMQDEAQLAAFEAQTPTLEISAEDTANLAGATHITVAQGSATFGWGAEGKIFL